MRQSAELTRAMYPQGTKLELILMMDDPDPILPGTKGTVLNVDDMGQIHMDWENGRTLALLPGHDLFNIIEEGEALR